MIKCNVTINGIVSRTASMRTNKEGKSYISFAVKISILAKAGSSKQVEVFVSKNGTTAELLSYVTRSEERRVGKECLRLCRSRWSPYH